MRCQQSALTPQTVAILGDSHAEQLFLGVAQNAPTHENVVYFTFSCPPFYGLHRSDTQECENMQSALEFVSASSSIHTVMITAFWEDRLLYGEIRESANPDEDNKAEIFTRGLDRTLQILTSSGKKIVFLHDVPTLTFDPQRCMRKIASKTFDCFVDQETALHDQQKYRALAADVLGRYKAVRVWDPFQAMCKFNRCPAMKEGRFVYRDRSHITTMTSVELGDSIWRGLQL